MAIPLSSLTCLTRHCHSSLSTQSSLLSVLKCFIHNIFHPYILKPARTFSNLEQTYEFNFNMIYEQNCICIDQVLINICVVLYDIWYIVHCPLSNQYMQNMTELLENNFNGQMIWKLYGQLSQF